MILDQSWWSKEQLTQKVPFSTTLIDYDARLVFFEKMYQKSSSFEVFKYILVHDNLLYT